MKNLIKVCYHTLNEVPSVFTDGMLYGFIATFVFMQGYLSGEESYKYVNPYLLFWMKFSVGSVAAFLGAIKMFRSKSYGEYTNNKPDDKKPDNPS